MKIAVVGCGAMGSVYAALLGDSGNEVWALSRRLDHVEAIERNGLRLQGPSGDRTVRIRATTDSTQVGLCDLVIIATKVRDVKAGAELAKPLIGEGTAVLTIQNGIGGPDAAAAVLGFDRILVGVASGFGASLRGPGHAQHTGWEVMRLGELNGPVTPRLEAIANVWRAAGFNVECFDNIDQLIWEKLICNAAFSGPCTIAEHTIGELIADPDMWHLAAGCATEAFRVARARGIDLDFDDPVGYVRAFGLRHAEARPSMLLDHLAGRASEIDALNGAIPPAAAAVNLTAPFNEAVSSVVRAKERRRGMRDR